MSEMSKTLYPQGVLTLGPRETLAIIEFREIVSRKIIDPREVRCDETLSLGCVVIGKFSLRLTCVIDGETRVEISSKNEIVAFASNRMLAIDEICYSDCKYHSDSEEENKMTKAELIEEIAKQAECTKADAERTLTAFFDLVVASTKKGEKVAWPGFGSFSTTARKERTGRNPQTGAAVTVPASTAMKFTASSTLKAQLNPNRK
jgi:DNA-binding protein HU-beta